MSPHDEGPVVHLKSSHKEVCDQNILGPLTMTGRGESESDTE